jgi:hypothetical protein
MASSVTASRWASPSMSGQYFFEYGRFGCAAAQGHRPAQRGGEDLVAVGLLGGEGGAVGEGDAQRRQRLAARGLGEGGAAVEEAGPFARVLGAGHFPAGGVHQGEGPVPKQPALADGADVEFLPLHRLDRVAPQGDDGADDLVVACHGGPPR